MGRGGNGMRTLVYGLGDTNRPRVPRRTSVNLYWSVTSVTLHLSSGTPLTSSGEGTRQSDCKNGCWRLKGFRSSREGAPQGAPGDAWGSSMSTEISEDGRERRKPTVDGEGLLIVPRLRPMEGTNVQVREIDSTHLG